MKSRCNIACAIAAAAILAAAGSSARAADAPPIKLGQIEDSSGQFRRRRRA